MKPRFGSWLLLALALPLLANSAPVPQQATQQQPASRAAAPGVTVLPSPSIGVDVPLPASVRWNVAQLRQSFDLADANRNGELSRAEAQQLIILPRTFEELDANHDGVLSRVEYESILAR
ncbi:MAG TPA: EF-hand domain-containing protein [Ramlibacter sp.]|uniref:EF-hand domain-containing protein n=1 Tax=Ramlibacter sp. TaxID=1917967 RepID=UPI002CE7EEB2|nr:EF-hand domain-containing protein [Ramlibacter sp.]HVZ42552.1 EF-hand domain-containing protein [Ramlibacter sp.]